ncbi:MAG: queuosine precursor transporter [Candidatus Marinimicrobia bacterium]|nr:queuosine precursor transporter [Candidatus Neomarinimicrobiota bacterium]MDP6853477.1 queuosine precursor transporter [Candidatus Neomarinimicrobiota bacterium]MDP6937006.1 queuosine precursor transporter [Candidatus Neomarinimicrobiota bacterium]
MFIASLVSSNLIFQKFFYWTPLSEFTFELSVGILPYPITFLITDIISEIYGREKANRVVVSGFISSIFIMGIVSIADIAPATAWSPIDDPTFHKVFGLFGPAIIASLTAYVTAQFIDIRIFHFWKNLTKGRHLWLRNNGSTIFSQLVDTSAVLLLLCSFGAIEWMRFLPLLVNGFLFKVLIALVDTPFFYLFSHLLRNVFQLRVGEELENET